MKILDEDGKLLGLINIIDALVIVFVLAVIVAGAAFMFSEDSTETETATATTYVTLDLGEQPTYIASEINAGDTHSAGGSSQLTLTDVYLTPQGEATRVIVRAKVQAPTSGDSISYSGAPPRLGRTLQITTDRYQVNGQIQAVGQNDTLPRSETTLTIQSTIDATNTREVTPGDEVRIGGRTVATIEKVTEYATQNPNQKRVIVGVSVHTLMSDRGELFGMVPVKQGAEITLDTSEYTLSGPIQRVGTTEPLGSVATRTVTLQMSEVKREIADTIQPGMTEQSGGMTTARVTDVDVEPSLMITTGDDGSVNISEHPTDREVTITTELQVRETTNGVQFKGEPLHQGSTVVIDFGTVIIRASVISVGS